MRTHTVIDGNAFYEVDDECMERLKLGKKDKTGDADIRTVRQNEYGFRPENNERNVRRVRRAGGFSPVS